MVINSVSKFVQENRNRGGEREELKKKTRGNEGGMNEQKRKTKGTPSTSSSVAPPNLHLQQPLHQKQSKAFQGKKKGGGMKKKGNKKEKTERKGSQTQGVAS